MSSTAGWRQEAIDLGINIPDHSREVTNDYIIRRRTVDYAFQPASALW
jgi:hypothetical protein